MNQIFPRRLWIGHAGDGRDFQNIFDNDIKAIVQLATEEPPLQPPRELIYLRFPLVDSSGNDPFILDLAISCVTTLIQKEMPTLVCCSGGMSRSPAIVVAALAAVEHVDYEASLKWIIESHPADVSPGLWQEIIHHIKKLDKSNHDRA